MAFIEVKEAIKLFRDFLRRNDSIPHDNLDDFCRILENLLGEKYKNHWHPQRPHKGSAFRCLRLSNRHMDSVIMTAARESGVTEQDLARTLPTELTVWIDPFEVSYRIGEEGSICQLFQGCIEDVTGQSKTKMAQVAPSPCRVESQAVTGFENPNETLQECQVDVA